MSAITALVKRNLKLYFRDKALVFYSFMSVLIIIGLYALFLGNVMMNGIQQSIHSHQNARFFVDSWIMSGLVLVNAINVPLMFFSIMVSDRHRGKLKDFTVSPVKRSSLVAGYLIAAWIIGSVMEIVTIGLAECYIIAFGGAMLSPSSLINAILASILCVVSYSAVFFFIAQFLKSTSAFSTLCTIVGTLTGFVGGIYIPIGSLPLNIQSAMKCIPVTYSASLLREIFTSSSLNSLFQGAPQAVKDTFAQTFGIQVKVGTTMVPNLWLVLVTILNGVIFYILSVFAATHASRKNT